MANRLVFDPTAVGLNTSGDDIAVAMAKKVRWNCMENRTTVGLGKNVAVARLNNNWFGAVSTRCSGTHSEQNLLFNFFSQKARSSLGIGLSNPDFLLYTEYYPCDGCLEVFERIRQHLAVRPRHREKFLGKDDFFDYKSRLFYSHPYPSSIHRTEIRRMYRQWHNNLAQHTPVFNSSLPGIEIDYREIEVRLLEDLV